LGNLASSRSLGTGAVLVMGVLGEGADTKACLVTGAIAAGDGSAAVWTLVFGPKACWRLPLIKFSHCWLATAGGLTAVAGLACFAMSRAMFGAREMLGAAMGGWYPPP
jgi:hypothetical protein